MPDHDNCIGTCDELAAWLRDVADGLACCDADGHDLLPLYGGLPPMDGVLEVVVDKLLAADLVAWRPPLVRALERRSDNGATGVLTPAQADRLVAWSRHHSDRRYAAWLALAAAVCGSDGTWDDVHRQLERHGEAAVAARAAAVARTAVPWDDDLVVTTRGDGWSWGFEFDDGP